VRVTVEKVLALNPCYSREEIKTLAAGRKWVRPRTIAKMDIAYRDRLWVLTGLMSGQQQGEFARRCALDVKRFWDAPDIVKKYLETGDGAIMEAAREAAWTAGRPAFADQTWDRARSSAFSASQAGSWDACRDASWDAVYANVASRRLAWEKYISWCVEYLDQQ
jgi:hypothetical protein